MSRLLLLVTLICFVSVAASTQAASLLGVTYFEGELWEVDPRTGSTAYIGSTSRTLLNSLTSHRGVLYSVSNGTGELIGIDPATGLVVSSLSLDFGPFAVDVTGLAFSPDGRLFAVQRVPQISLHEIDRDTGQARFVGNLPSSPFQALEFAPWGELYGWNTASGLLTVDVDSGAVTDVNESVVGDAMQSLAFDIDGTLYGVLNGADFGRFTGTEIYVVDVATGVPTLSAFTGRVGPPLRGIAFVPEPGVTAFLAMACGILAGLRRYPDVGRRPGSATLQFLRCWTQGNG